MPATQDARLMEVLEHFYTVVLHPSEHTIVLRGTFGNTKFGCYAIVAVVNTYAKDWACYIGVAPKEYSEADTMTAVAETGHKMSKREADTWFHLLFEAGLHYRE